jgi:hypothetical protein
MPICYGSVHCNFHVLDKISERSGVKQTKNSICFNLSVNVIFRDNSSRYSDGLRAGRPEFDSWQGKKFFSLLHSVQIDSEAHQIGTGVKAAMA